MAADIKLPLHERECLGGGGGEVVLGLSGLQFSGRWCVGFWVQVFWVQGSGFRAQGLGCRILVFGASGFGV